MKLKIEFDCDSAVFGDDNESRLAEIKEVIDRLFCDLGRLEVGTSLVVRDSNGNRIGSAGFAK